MVDNANDPAESTTVLARQRGPTSPSVKLSGAALSKQVPLEANTELEAFRHQADINRDALSFSLDGTATASMSNSISAGVKLSPFKIRRPELQNQASTPAPQQNLSFEAQMGMDSEKDRGSEYGCWMEWNRNSEDKSTTPNGGRSSPSLEIPRFQSPAQVESLLATAQWSSLAKLDDPEARMSFDQKMYPGQVRSPALRADSLPSKLESGGPSMLRPVQLKDMLEAASDGDIMLLDVRSYGAFSTSRISGALNLCFPSTLLKRPTYDLQKLQQHVTGCRNQERFSKWRDTKCVVVYDACSSEKSDARTAVALLKKFQNEKYTGMIYILRGGFVAFMRAHPHLVDTAVVGDIGASLSLSVRSGPKAKTVPVIGGVTLPTCTNGANPFFANIRQNTDLQDGVGQEPVKLPQRLDVGVLPGWLRSAADPADEGKAVSDKFLHIEKTEQTRMKTAYASLGAPVCQHDAARVQLCGIEKGGKNRYRDILPFEHARVKLRNKPFGGCDYVNASHVKSKRSNKKYIAAQGPLPDTFGDFWSVIWDQDVRVIVMLTAESEGGQMKCHPYWRDEQFGPIKLRTISEEKVSLDMDKHWHKSTKSTPPSTRSLGHRRVTTTTILESSTSTTLHPPQKQEDKPLVIVRKFALRNTAYPFEPVREVNHLHYASWPDFGTPAQASHLLALVELANVMQRAATRRHFTALVPSSRPTSLKLMPLMPGADEPEPDSASRPMLVHCSAGCGRTGAFCTVDTVVDMLKRQRLFRLNKAKDWDGNALMGSNQSVTPNPPSVTTTPLSETKKASTTETALNLDLSWIGDENFDLIQKTVEDFREQRISMVQSIRQYVLCYETVVEWICRACCGPNQVCAGGQGIRGRGRSGSVAVLGRRAD